MVAAPKILAFAGSLRTGSFNKKLVKIAAQGARHAGAHVTFIDLRDFPMPLFDADLEQRDGLPETVRQLKQLLRAHDGWLIASPEYNSSFSGVLKNAIDWASRQQTDEEPPLACFVGKVAALMSASAGAHGGIRGLIQLRTTLSNIRVLVLPEQITIARAPDAFNNDGSLKDAKQQASVEKLGAMLTDTLRKLKAA